MILLRTIFKSIKNNSCIFKYLVKPNHNATAGGTEIQLAYLKKHCDEGVLNSVQITTSIPEKEPLDPVKANILWLKILRST